MRGELLELESVINEQELHLALEDLLQHYFGRAVRVERLAHRVSEYCSSFIIEEIDVTLDDGSTLSLVLKDLSNSALLEGAGRVKPRFFYDPMREIETYRRVLVQHHLGTATCYGAVVDRERERYWLFLERLPPVLLWQMGEFERWLDVARWLAGMHTYLVRDTEVPESSHIAHLLTYDEAFYTLWMTRAVSFVCEGDASHGQKAARAVRWLADRFERVTDRLASLPVTVIHGEFFASNVMIDQSGERLRVCPVDWEMAAVAPGLVDLAGLTSGNWTGDEKKAMALAYHAALPEESPAKTEIAEFLENLEYCRLAQAVQWLGWSPGWEAPPEHAQDWLREAVRSAQLIGL